MKKILPVVFIFVVTISSCTSTRITSSWREPGKEVVVNQLNKVLIVALFKTAVNSHKAEDQMAAYLNGKGVVSYDYLDNNFNKKNEEAIRTKIKADGFDGAITMRLADVDRDKIYVPGNMAAYPAYLRTFSGYYYNNWPNYLSGGYYKNTKTYTVEVNVYSIKEDKMIWTGITQTTDPNGVKRMTANIAKVVYRQMIKEGFVHKP